MAILKCSMWRCNKVTLKFRRRVVGGIPNRKDLILGWLKANMGLITTEEQRQVIAEKTLQECRVEVDTTVSPEGDEAKGVTGITEEEAAKKAAEAVANEAATVFKCDEKGFYLEGRCVKAMFKEAAKVLRDLLTADEAELAKAGKALPEDKDKAKEASEAMAKALGDGDDEDDEPHKGKGKKSKKPKEPKEKRVVSRFTALRARTAERLFVEQDKVYLMRDGKHITKEDGKEERPIHVDGPQGKKTALKRFHFVNEPSITFTCRYLRDGIIDKELIGIFLEYAGWNGLGADRSQGEGMFDVVGITD